MFITGQRTISTAPRNPSQEDFTRSLKHSNFLVTQTNAQTTDWTSSYLFPPYDGQLRQERYTHLSYGADMVEYWHWASSAANQETLLEGCPFARLGTQPRLCEVSRTAHELERIGPHLVGLKIHSQVAILWSRDSLNAISFMPFASSAGNGASGLPLLTTPRWFSRCTARSTI